jgi:hypothetical protein
MRTIPADPLDAVTLLVTRTCDTCKHAYSTTLTLDRMRRTRTCDACLETEQADYELENVLSRYYAGEMEDA